MGCRPRLRTCLAADKNNMLGGAIIREGAGTVTLSLSLLTVEIIVQFLLEQTVLEKYVHTFATFTQFIKHLSCSAQFKCIVRMTLVMITW